MTHREFFVETVKDELPRFERALKAVPDARLDYRPHEKSRSARELLGVFSQESQMFDPILQTGDVEMNDFPPATPKGVADALAVLVRALTAAQQSAAALSEHQWGSPARILAGGKAEWETTRGKMAWGLLLDLIHHRGQLSVYIRPMGGQVPPIYGPSADAPS